MDTINEKIYNMNINKEFSGGCSNNHLSITHSQHIESRERWNNRYSWHDDRYYNYNRQDSHHNST